MLTRHGNVLTSAAPTRIADPRAFVRSRRECVSASFAYPPMPENLHRGCAACLTNSSWPRSVRVRPRSSTGWKTAAHGLLSPRMWLAVLLMASGVSAAADVTSAAASNPRTTRLTVLVGGLPRAVAANVVVQGPAGFRRVIRKSVTLPVARPGVYRLSPRPVRLARGVRGIEAGSTDFPATGGMVVRVRSHEHAAVRVEYGTVRSGRVRTLSARPAAVFGNPRNPREIVLAGHPTLGVGTIIASAPTAALPRGLFDRVTATHQAKHNATLSLAPATLSDAFPRIDLNQPLPLRLAPAQAVSSARAASATGSINVSNHDYGAELASLCNVSGPLTFDPTFTGDVTGHASLHWPEARSSLRLQFTGSVAAVFTAEAGLDCNKELTALQATTDIPVDGVPVPVTGKLKLKVTLKTSAAASLKAGVTLFAWGEASLDPLFSLGAAAGAQIDTRLESGARVAGELVVTPVVEAEVGMEEANLHAEAGPQLALSGEIGKEDGCELALNGYVEAGGQLFGLSESISKTFPLFAKGGLVNGPLYVCPTQAPQDTVAPQINHSGPFQPGTTLVTDNGTWSSTIGSMTYSYQWQRCNAAGEQCVNINDATGLEYKLTDADVGATIRVVVTAFNGVQTASASSNATGLVEPAASHPSSITFDGSPGSGPPPATLGGYSMRSFPIDVSELGAHESTIAGPDGMLTFSGPVVHEQVGSGWATWSNGYDGDVYLVEELNTEEVPEVTITLPAGTGAFYLYAEPDEFEDFSITATAQDGATSGPTTVFGEGGAGYFGFYASCGNEVATVRVTDGPGDPVLGIGEFGIAPASSRC